MYDFCTGRSVFYSWLSWFYLFGVSVFSSICLLLVNILLVLGVRRLQLRRLRQSDLSHVTSALDKLQLLTAAERRRRNELNLTRTVVAVIVVFIVGELPSSFTSRAMIGALLGHRWRRRDVSQVEQEIFSSTGYRIAVLVSTILVVTQHSVNFIVYCVFNRRFCEEVVRSLLHVRHSYRHSGPYDGQPMTGVDRQVRQSSDEALDTGK